MTDFLFHLTYTDGEGSRPTSYICFFPTSTYSSIWLVANDLCY